MLSRLSGYQRYMISIKGRCVLHNGFKWKNLSDIKIPRAWLWVECLILMMEPQVRVSHWNMMRTVTCSWLWKRAPPHSQAQTVPFKDKVKRAKGAANFLRKQGKNLHLLEKRAAAHLGRRLLILQAWLLKNKGQENNERCMWTRNLVRLKISKWIQYQSISAKEAIKAELRL